MIDRVNRYYQFPASKKLVSHFREDIGLTELIRLAEIGLEAESKTEE